MYTVVVLCYLHHCLLSCVVNERAKDKGGEGEARREEGEETEGGGGGGGGGEEGDRERRGRRERDRGGGGGGRKLGLQLYAETVEKWMTGICCAVGGDLRLYICIG